MSGRTIAMLNMVSPHDVCGGDYAELGIGATISTTRTFRQWDSGLDAIVAHSGSRVCSGSERFIALTASHRSAGSLAILTVFAFELFFSLPHFCPLPYVWHFRFDPIEFRDALIHHSGGANNTDLLMMVLGSRE